MEKKRKKRKYLVINLEAFSPKGLKQKKSLDYTDLPWIVRRFLLFCPDPFIVLDESSRCRVSAPMKEDKKSTRTRLVKLLNTVGQRCIMTGTLMSKSPLNLIDQFDFLKKGYFPENMYEFAEKYCIMETIRVGRGRRVLISQKDYEEIRRRLRRAFNRGGDFGLDAAKNYIFKQYGIDYKKQDHIIQHRRYTPFLHVDELMERISGDTMFVKREDVFDIKFDKFVKEPIARTFELSDEAKRIGNELVNIGFTDQFTLGKAAALDLQIRLQDICNGFEPVKDEESGDISYKPFWENAKLDCLMELLEEIDVERNQVVIWSSRRLILRAAGDALASTGVSYVVFDGDSSEDDKAEAQRAFQGRRAQVFLANQASGSYGLNCLAQCSYAVYLCVDGSVERYYQSQHRILRGQLTAPKFAYAIYAKNSIEEKQWNSLRVGQELIGAENRKETFEFH